MVAYRFCRPDDIPRLVDAVNRCYTAHFPAAAPFTVDSFRREMKEVQLWPSNSMIASAGDDPVAVVLGTKRPREVLVRRIGVAPGHQGQGHGRHLLGSLSQKLAVLGPPRLLAEVPGEMEAARRFFAAAGWREEASLRDWERPAGANDRPPPTADLEPVTAAELEGEGVLAGATAWERQPEALRARDDLRGLALCGAERLEAWALFHPVAGRTDVLALGCREPAHAAAALALLCARVQELLPGALRLRWLEDGEVDGRLLEGLGFAPAGTTIRFATEAIAA